MYKFSRRNKRLFNVATYVRHAASLAGISWESSGSNSHLSLSCASVSDESNIYRSPNSAILQESENDSMEGLIFSVYLGILLSSMSLQSFHCQWGPRVVKHKLLPHNQLQIGYNTKGVYYMYLL